MATENSKVIDLNVKKEDRILDFSDFQKQEIKFDIEKLQEAYHQIVKIKKFEDAGVTHFGAISLTQIPGDPDSIKVIKLVEYTGLNLINQEKKFLETKWLMKHLTQNLLKTMRTHILKRFMMSFQKI